MNFKKTGKVFTSKFVGTGPSSHKKGTYWAAVSWRLRTTGLRSPHWYVLVHSVQYERRHLLCLFTGTMHYTARTETLALLVHWNYALHSTNGDTCSACSLGLCTTQHEQSNLLCLFTGTVHYTARTETLAMLVHWDYALHSTNGDTCSACSLGLCTTQFKRVGPLEPSVQVGVV
jgi:hypothetical protein